MEALFVVSQACALLFLQSVEAISACRGYCRGFVGSGSQSPKEEDISAQHGENWERLFFTAFLPLVAMLQV